MVLEEVTRRISGAVQGMCNAKLFDDQVLQNCLYEISAALLQADVSISILKEMERNIMMKRVDLKRYWGWIIHQVTNEDKIIQQAIFRELCKILDSGKPAFAPRKREPSVVLFVGLQGSGKTTACAKYARYHHKRGYNPALVCADTFRVDAFDQLKQNAIRTRIPFYGSYTESDPAKIAAEGIERFRKDGCDLIIVDTSSRHKQEVALFEETCQLVEVTKPDLVILVVDSRNGQAALDQAAAFKQNVGIGAVVLSKLDGHTKGVGALCALASSKSPVIFVGTGEHVDELEVFDVKPFVGRLMGMGDWSRVMDKIYEVVPEDHQCELMGKRAQGKFTLRCLYEQLERWVKWEQASCQILAAVVGRSRLSLAKMERYLSIMDSMTSEELDTPMPSRIKKSRRIRIARGSGQDIREVEEVVRLAKRHWLALGRMSFPTSNVNFPVVSNYMNPQPQPQPPQANVSFRLPPQIFRPQALARFRELVLTRLMQ